jgi:hypothetical protein
MLYSQESVDLGKVAYVNSQIACAFIELEAMKSENQLALLQGISPAWSYAEFMKLLDKYQLTHDLVINNL